MAKFSHHDYDLTLMVWESWFNDPIYNMEILRDTSTDKNYPGWENPRYTALLKAADDEIDIEKRREYLRMAEDIVLEELPIIPVINRNSPCLQKEYLKGLLFSPTGQVEFKYISIEDKDF